MPILITNHELKYKLWRIAGFFDRLPRKYTDRPVMNDLQRVTVNGGYH